MPHSFRKAPFLQGAFLCPVGLCLRRSLESIETDCRAMSVWINKKGASPNNLSSQWGPGLTAPMATSPCFTALPAIGQCRCNREVTPKWRARRWANRLRLHRRAVNIRRSALISHAGQQSPGRQRNHPALFGKASGRSRSHMPARIRWRLAANPHLSSVARSRPADGRTPQANHAHQKVVID